MIDLHVDCSVFVFVNVCVSAWVPGSVMVPGGRPASISEQQALAHCPSIDGPPVPDGGLLPAVTGQDMSVCACKAVIDTLNAPDTFIYIYCICRGVEREPSVGVCV